MNLSLGHDLCQKSKWRYNRQVPDDILAKTVLFYRARILPFALYAIWSKTICCHLFSSMLSDFFNGSSDQIPEVFDSNCLHF